MCSYESVILGRGTELGAVIDLFYCRRSFSLPTGVLGVKIPKSLLESLFSSFGSLLKVIRLGSKRFLNVSTELAFNDYFLILV